MIILSKRSKTARLVAERAGIPIVFNPHDVPDDEDIVVRWGNISPLYVEGYEIINGREQIARSANKPECRKFLSQVGIPVPKMTETTFPCIGRPTHHTEGRKFFICHNAEQVARAKRLGATYFSEVYPKTEEYRVHIGGGKCLLMSVKEGQKEGRICWNHHKTGFKLRHMHRSEWLEDEDLMSIVRLAKDTTSALELDFAAIDILAFPTDDLFPQAVVCEVNTAPALSDLAIEKYVMYLKRLQGERR